MVGLFPPGSTSTFGQGNSGLLQIVVTGDVVVDGVNSFISSVVASTAIGNSGGVSINTANLSVLNAASVTASTLGQGNSGPVQITATGDVVVDGVNSSIGSQVAPTAVGNSGGVSISAANLSVVNDAEVDVTTLGQGNSGQAQIVATGDVIVSGLGSFIGSQVAPTAVGNSGGVSITTTNLSVVNDALVTASTFGQGNSGAVQITATDDVVVDGVNSFISSEVASTAVGDSGGISIITPNLSVLNAAEVTASTFGNGTAGSLVLQSNNTADLNIFLANGGGIGATTRSQQRGGDLIIRSIGNLTIEGSGDLTVESFGSNTGPAGSFNIFSDTFILDGGVELSARTASIQGGGNVNFFVDEAIVMRRGSLVNAESTNPLAGDGGNVTLNTSFLIAPLNENNDVIANAVGGNGGRVEVNALSILTFEDPQGLTTAQLRARPTNDLSASSQAGIQGTVLQNSPDLDPSQGISELPADLTDRSNQITPGCGIANTDDGSSFIITGGGGLPPSPSDPIAANDIEVDWITYDGSGSVSSVQLPNANANTDFTQAQAMIIDPDGTVHFVADAETAVTQQSNATAVRPCAVTAQH